MAAVTHAGSNPGLHGIFFMFVTPATQATYFSQKPLNIHLSERCYATYDLHATLDLFVYTDTLAVTDSVKSYPSSGLIQSTQW